MRQKKLVESLVVNQARGDMVEFTVDTKETADAIVPILRRRMRYFVDEKRYTIQVKSGRLVGLESLCCSHPRGSAPLCTRGNSPEWNTTKSQASVQISWPGSSNVVTQLHGVHEPRATRSV